MSAPRTPSTSDFSTLETQERNDNTTLANTTPEVPDRSNGNEFEVEKRNEVYPNQTPPTKVTDDKLDDDENKKDNTNSKKDDNEDWDITKKK